MPDIAATRRSRVIVAKNQTYVAAFSANAAPTLTWAITIAAIGQDASQRAQKDDREELRHRHDAEPGARMRQGPGEPPDRDALQPGADQADGVAADIDAVVAVRKGRGDIAEPAGGMKVVGGQKRQNP